MCIRCENEVEEYDDDFSCPSKEDAGHSRCGKEELKGWGRNGEREQNKVKRRTKRGWVRRKESAVKDRGKSVSDHWTNEATSCCPHLSGQGTTTTRGELSQAGPSERENRPAARQAFRRLRSHVRYGTWDIASGDPTISTPLLRRCQCQLVVKFQGCHEPPSPSLWGVITLGHSIRCASNSETRKKERNWKRCHLYTKIVGIIIMTLVIGSLLRCWHVFSKFSEQQPFFVMCRTELSRRFAKKRPFLREKDVIIRAFENNGGASTIL